MATPKCSLNPVPWGQGGPLQVKVQEEEADLCLGEEASLSPSAHPEAARLRFRHFCYEEAPSPRAALAQLRELCDQWLRPESCSKEQMLQRLVLEQFLGTLPPTSRPGWATSAPRVGSRLQCWWRAGPWGWTREVRGSGRHTLTVCWTRGAGWALTHLSPCLNLSQALHCATGLFWLQVTKIPGQTGWGTAGSGVAVSRGRLLSSIGPGMRSPSSLSLVLLP